MSECQTIKYKGKRRRARATPTDPGEIELQNRVIAAVRARTGEPRDPPSSATQHRVDDYWRGGGSGVGLLSFFAGVVYNSRTIQYSYMLDSYPRAAPLKVPLPPNMKAKARQLRLRAQKVACARQHHQGVYAPRATNSSRHRHQKGNNGRQTLAGASNRSLKQQR